MHKIKKLKLKKNLIYIVTYHYVRNINKSKFPYIKGLEFHEFKKQITFFKKKFNILSPEEFFSYVEKKKIPNKTSILLTFDDGYKDHYEFVFKYLKKNNLKGLFYPPASILNKNCVLDVNKIQFFMAKEKNKKKIFMQIKKILKLKYKIDLDNFLKKNRNKILKINSKFDDKNTSLIKALLQKLLPKSQRKFIIDELFKVIVTKNIEKFSSELYLNFENIKEMRQSGMYFGSHGYDHEWWENLTKKNQEKELLKSIQFLKKIGINKNRLSVCFPYGSYNKETLGLLKKYSFKFGLTTLQDTVNLFNLKNPLTLPRYDTNYFKNFY